MRKIALTAISIVGAFVIGVAVMHLSAATGSAEQHGGGTDGRGSRQNLLALVDTGHGGRPLLVEMQIR
jgi:hypothetical protein